MNRTTSGASDHRGYQIRTRGHISDRWSEWFEGMDLIHDTDGTTVICSLDLDQAALQGLLAKVRDLGLELISVNPTGSTCAAAVEARTDDLKQRS